MSEIKERGFRSSKSYVTRENEEVLLSEEKIREFKVFEDILNRLMFVNVQDLKKSIEAPKIVKTNHLR
jgi:hypothetical protein